MIDKKFHELANGEREYLREERAKIVASFDSIVNFNEIHLTSKDKEFPLSDDTLKEIGYAIPTDSYWVDAEIYIKKALKPVKQEAWHDGVLEEEWYEWELDYLPLEKMFELFKEYHKKTQKELFGK